jgi:hypothetical protein
MARRRRHKPGNLDELRRVLWQTIVEVEALLDCRPPSHDVVLKSAHCLAQLAGAYHKLVVGTTVEERLQALEARQVLEEGRSDGRY